MYTFSIFRKYGQIWKQINKTLSIFFPYGLTESLCTNLAKKEPVNFPEAAMSIWASWKHKVSIALRPPQCDSGVKDNMQNLKGIFNARPTKV